jgi:hypothetical protein
MRQRGDVLDVTAETRGTQGLDEGGYLWRGELRIWDNEVLMGWYVATEGAVRSKGRRPLPDPSRRSLKPCWV